MTHLKEGDKAPVFKGINQNNKELSLSDYLGKRLILYFYPKDNTPGCTAEACNLNDNYSELTDMGFEVLGISPDTPSKHQNFITKYNLSFNLIADTKFEIMKSYGVWGEKSMYGKTFLGVYRTTFIISQEGVIEKIITKVKTKEHTAQILKEIDNK